MSDAVVRSSKLQWPPYPLVLIEGHTLGNQPLGDTKGKDNLNETTTFRLEP